MFHYFKKDIPGVCKLQYKRRAAELTGSELSFFFPSKMLSLCSSQSLLKNCQKCHITSCPGDECEANSPDWTAKAPEELFFPPQHGSTLQFTEEPGAGFDSLGTKQKPAQLESVSCSGGIYFSTFSQVLPFLLEVFVLNLSNFVLLYTYIELHSLENVVLFTPLPSILRL